MTVIIWISQAILYICFALLMGSFVLALVPQQYRPTIHVPKKVLVISAILVPWMAFLPVLDITLYIAPRLGFIESLKIVLTTYTIGTAWDATFLISFLLLLIIARTSLHSKWGSVLGALLTTLLMLTVAWSSHAASMDKAVGITSDVLHFLAMSIWVGILLVIGFFATNKNHWLAFLNWFSYTAIGCLATLTISGFLLMDILVSDYINAWMTNYGQGMLWKHLLLLPVVIFALANSLITRFKLSRDENFNPFPWIRLEGTLLTILLLVTAAFSQQPPPEHSITPEAVSAIFKWFHPDVVIEAGNMIGFVVNVQSVLFLFASLFSVVLLGISFFFKKIPPVVSFIIGCLFVSSVYMLLMVTTVIRPAGFMGGGMGH